MYSALTKFHFALEMKFPKVGKRNELQNGEIHETRDRPPDILQLSPSPSELADENRFRTRPHLVLKIRANITDEKGKRSSWIKYETIVDEGPKAG